MTTLEQLNQTYLTALEEHNVALDYYLNDVISKQVYEEFNAAWRIAFNELSSHIDKTIAGSHE